MRLVKVVQTSDQSWRVVAWKLVPYRASESPKSPSFAEFLGTIIQEFAGPPKNVDVWASVPPTHLDVRGLQIPKVPRKQVQGAVYWALKKDAGFDAQESLLDFEVIGESTEKGIPKIGVLAYTIPRQEIKTVRELFERSDVRLKGISAAPFALQNLFRTNWIPVRDRTFASLYIGNEYSRIDIFKGSRLVFTRGIKTGLNSMRDAVWEVVSEQIRTSTVFSFEELSVPTLLEDQQEAQRKLADSLLLSIVSDSVESVDPEIGFAVSQADAQRMIAPPLERIIRQVERTFKHFSTVSQDEAVSMIGVYSSVALGAPVISMIGNQLGIESWNIDPFSESVHPVGGAPGPPSPSERGGFTSALGLALSDNSRTPNFLFTHEDREADAKVARINLSTFAAFLILVALCLSVFFYQSRMISFKRNEISQLNDSLQSSPLVNQTLVAQLSARVNQQREILRARIRNLAGVAVLGELSHFTPRNIRLMSVSLDSRGMEGKGTDKALHLEGIVRGDKQAMEASLARFVMKLSSSPLMKNPQVQRSSFEVFVGEGEVLHFILRLEVG